MSFHSRQKNATGKTQPKEQEQGETEMEIEQIEMHPPRGSQLKEKERVETETEEREPIELRPRGGRNNDPRRLRLLARLTNAPPGIGRGMERKIAFENQKFEERETDLEQNRSPIDKRMGRKLAFETDQFNQRNAPESPPPQRNPLPPPTPLVLPNDPGDAILAIRNASVAAQDSLRRAYDMMAAVKSTFTEQQTRRQNGEGGDEPAKAMGRIIEGVRQTFDGCGVERTRLSELANQLSSIAVNLPGIPPAVVALHQKVTTELNARMVQAKTVFDAAKDLAERLESARYGTSTFKTTDAMPGYVPTPTELPSLLRELTMRLRELTPAFQEAARQLTPLAGEVEGLFAKAVKGTALPEGTVARLTVIEGNAGGRCQPFGGWHGSGSQPYRALALLLGPQVKPIPVEIATLTGQMTAAYDPYTRAFGEASQTNQKITHFIAQLRAMLAPQAVSPQAAAQELSKLAEKIEHLGISVEKPIQRLSDKKSDLADRKRLPDPAGIAAIGPLQERLVELNRDFESVRDSNLSLQQAQQQLAMTEQLLTTRFTGQKALSKQVATARKAAQQIGKQVGPALSEGTKTEAGYTALIEAINKRLAKLGPATSVEETVRLSAALAALPPAPGEDAVLPAHGSSEASAQLGKGGDRQGASLFANVTKAWAAVEKNATESNLAALEKAAALYLSYYDGKTKPNPQQDQPPPVDPTDSGRADKCRAALTAVRKLRQGTARASLPPPPWSEEQARAARQIEVASLLDNGVEARPPSTKGESDSFFLKDSSGKTAFIFKPKQGENVKEGGREGEGVAREVLSSKFNDQMKEMIGVDFGVCPTGLARLDSDSFAQEDEVDNEDLAKRPKSQSKSRVGALQQTVANQGNLLDQCGNDPTVAQKIPVEDVQKIALLDFLTLQGDRNPENILVRDEGGKKRLVPIDGGFAFPTTEMVSTFGQGMSADVKGGKTGTVQPGQNGLMQLPQTDQKFTPEMLKAIEQIDPAAIVKGMKQANAEMVSQAPELDGMVGDENLENMRRAAVFLKKAAPEFTVAELADAYATDFKLIVALPPNKVAAAIAKLLETMAARRDFNKDVRAAELTYRELGGDQELTRLGWNAQDDLLLPDWNRKIEILRKATKPPPPPRVVVEPVKPMDEEARLQKYNAMGGDKELTKLVRRPDAQYSPKTDASSRLSQKLGRLQAWQDYQDQGGDRGYQRLLALYAENRYRRFDTLEGEAKAAVVALSRTSWDLETLRLDMKAGVMQRFAKFKDG